MNLYNSLLNLKNKHSKIVRGIATGVATVTLFVTLPSCKNNEINSISESVLYENYKELLKKIEKGQYIVERGNDGTSYEITTYDIVETPKYGINSNGEKYAESTEEVLIISGKYTMSEEDAIKLNLKNFFEEKLSIKQKSKI